jgi:hypothetical protein
MTKQCVDWSDKTCIDCGADVSWLGHFASWIKDKGYICNDCKAASDVEWFDKQLES